MRIRLGYLTPIFGSVAAAVAIAAAPIASAAPSAATPQQTCTGNSAGTVCQSPGNVQIDDAAPPVQFDPYPGEGFLP